MEARKLYIDTTARRFVAGPDSTLPVGTVAAFAEDVEQIDLHFLEPTGVFAEPYAFADYSGNTVKLAVGLTQPAVLQTTWSTISTTVAITVSTTITGATGVAEVQSIAIAPKPATGGFALQIPARSIAVASVSGGTFVCTQNHGLFDGQSVTLTAFTISSGFTNGNVYFIRDRSNTTFKIAETPAGTALTPVVTSGGGTAQLAAVTTPTLPPAPSAAEVERAFIDAGIAIDGAPQILVSGTAGKAYTVTFASAMSGIDVGTLTTIGNTLAAAPGLRANVSFNTAEVATLIAAGNTDVTLEVEVSDGTLRQTFQGDATLAADIIDSASSPALALTTASGFLLMSADGTVWEITPDNAGVLQATATAGTSAPSGLLLRSLNGTAYTLSITNTGQLQTTPA